MGSHSNSMADGSDTERSISPSGPMLNHRICDPYKTQASYSLRRRKYRRRGVNARAQRRSRYGIQTRLN